MRNDQLEKAAREHAAKADNHFLQTEAYNDFKAGAEWQATVNPIPEPQLLDAAKEIAALFGPRLSMEGATGFAPVGAIYDVLLRRFGKAKGGQP